MVCPLIKTNYNSTYNNMKQRKASNIHIWKCWICILLMEINDSRWLVVYLKPWGIFTKLSTVTGIFTIFQHSRYLLTHFICMKRHWTTFVPVVIRLLTGNRAESRIKNLLTQRRTWVIYEASRADFHQVEEPLSTECDVAALYQTMEYLIGRKQQRFKLHVLCLLHMMGLQTERGLIIKKMSFIWFSTVELTFQLHLLLRPCGWRKLFISVMSSTAEKCIALTIACDHISYI